MINIVSSIICTTFENEIKRWQCRNEKQFAMKVSFSLSLDYDKEEGYRNLDILIFAPMNYVGVLVRERWTIIPVNEIEDEDSLKPGCDYREGDSGWLFASYHDSCWTSDGVERTIQKNRDRINCLSACIGTWYEKIEMTPELLERFELLTSGRSSTFYRDYHYEVGKNVLKFEDNNANK